MKIRLSVKFHLLEDISDMLKLKPSNYTPRRRLGEKRYSSCSFLASALDVGEWSVSLPGHALAPGKGPTVPIVQESV
jgi:hypothetical protein